jgi:excisionase family DNA binding protein
MGNRLSLDQVATQLGVSKRTVRRLISSGELPAVRVGTSSIIRVDADDLAAIVHPVTPNGKR